MLGLFISGCVGLAVALAGRQLARFAADPDGDARRAAQAAAFNAQMADDCRRWQASLRS